MEEYLPWIIVAVLAVVAIYLAVLANHQHKHIKVLESDIGDLSAEHATYEEKLRYNVTAEEHPALASFLADHLASNSHHPSNQVIANILTRWSSR